MSKQNKTAGKTAEKVAASAAKNDKSTKIVGYLVRVDMIVQTASDSKLYRVIGRQNDNYAECVREQEGIDTISNIEETLCAFDDLLCKRRRSAPSRIEHVRHWICARRSRQ